MQTFSLCQKYNLLNQIPVSINKPISDGADGMILSIQNNNTQVLKISVRYDNVDEFSQIKQTISYVKDHNPDFYVKVYDFGSLGIHHRIIYPSISQEFILYYYIMEKLNHISDDEKKVFHSILSHEDLGLIKNYNSSELRGILFNLNRGLDFDPARITIFYEGIKKSPVIQNDIHPRNIMKDHSGNFKFIDLDRAYLIT